MLPVLRRGTACSKMATQNWGRLNCWNSNSKVSTFSSSGRSTWPISKGDGLDILEVTLPWALPPLWKNPKTMIYVKKALCFYSQHYIIKITNNQAEWENWPKKNYSIQTTIDGSNVIPPEFLPLWIKQIFGQQDLYRWFIIL